MSRYNNSRLLRVKYEADIDRRVNMDLAIGQHVHSVHLTNYITKYYGIKTIDGLKLFSFLWSSKTGWNVYKRDYITNYISNIPSVFVTNQIWDLKELVQYIKFVNVEHHTNLGVPTKPIDVIS